MHEPGAESVARDSLDVGVEGACVAYGENACLRQVGRKRLQGLRDTGLVVGVACLVLAVARCVVAEDVDENELGLRLQQGRLAHLRGEIPRRRFVGGEVEGASPHSRIRGEEPGVDAAHRGVGAGRPRVRPGLLKRTLRVRGVPNGVGAAEHGDRARVGGTARPSSGGERSDHDRRRKC